MENIHILIGEKITEQRKRASMSQTELAEKLNKSLRTVQKYESGEIDMPVSVLKQIAETLNISLNYLVGYDSSHIKLENVSDVLAFLYELDRKKEIQFDIELIKTDMEDWKCSLVFDGKHKEAIHNCDICIEMENLKNNREALETYWIGYDTYEAWEKQSVEHFKSWPLTDKKREYLDTTQRIIKRNELDKLRLEEMRKKSQQNDDSER